MTEDQRQAPDPGAAPLARAEMRWDEAQARRYWREVSRHRGRGSTRKLLVPLCPLAVILGLVPWVVFPEPGLALAIVSRLAVGMGVFAGLLYFVLRWYTLRTLRRMPNADGTITFQFYEDAVAHQSPTGEGCIRYEAFTEVQTTPNGLFLRPTAGVIYLEDAGLHPPEAKEEIARRVEQAGARRVGRR